MTGAVRSAGQRSHTVTRCVRARGVGACVATFTVGGLSIINAIAGAYSEDLPVICITGGEPRRVEVHLL